MKPTTKTKILIVVARFLNRVEIWQLRLIVLRLKITRAPGELRRWFMANVRHCAFEVRVQYADASPRSWWVSEGALKEMQFTPLGESDGHGRVVQWDVERIGA